MDSTCLALFLFSLHSKKSKGNGGKFSRFSLLTVRTSVRAIPLTHTFKAPWEKALKMATYSLRQRERKSLHLIFSALINERNGISACCPSFQCLCRAHFAPFEKQFYQIFKELFKSQFYNTIDCGDFQGVVFSFSILVLMEVALKHF